MSKVVCNKRGTASNLSEMSANVENGVIEGGCPVCDIKAPVSVKRLAEAGKFDPRSSRCRKCAKNLNYRRCMPIYGNMSLADKMMIDAILENRPGYVERITVDCQSFIPAP